MLIFSYVDILDSSMNVLKRINSKGYDLYHKLNKYRDLFVAYTKTRTMGLNLISFNEEEIF